MERKIRVGAVSYLNTKPLIYGFENGLMKDEIDLIIDYPANIAKSLLNDDIDIGLLPVAVIPQMSEYHIVSDFCIAGDGAVASVCLFSEVPLAEIKKVILDYQSRTSVALVQILIKEYWKINPVIANGEADFRAEINGSTAAVVIGDRALEQRKTSSYVYDLGLAWKDYTGLPFVYAAWISNKPMSDDFINRFNLANQYGLDKLAEVISNIKMPEIDLQKYFTENILYNLNEQRRRGLEEFLLKLGYYF